MDIRRHLDVVERGGGEVSQCGNRRRLHRPISTNQVYADAELSDCGPWRPPLFMSVQARFSHPITALRGTAGFGFWNAALAPGSAPLRLPRTVWFFASGPPYDVPLALDIPGRGFKAAILDAMRPGFLALIPTAPVGFLAMRVPSLYRRLWPIAQTALGVSEVTLEDVDVTETHDYSLRWENRQVRFAVDGKTVLHTTASPGGPLRFVAWIDNAYAIATPRGHFELGLVATNEPQWIDIESIEIQTG